MTNAEARFNKIHIRKVYACLAVTCHLHFWQNDWDALCANAVTKGWNGYRNEKTQKDDPGEENSPTAPDWIRTQELLRTGNLSIFQYF